ncbi:MAG: RNA polymerase sigma factor [Myxococcales bacterium]|nr:RNA polymerase sigma factor [Myxococcales bacterium]
MSPADFAALYERELSYVWNSLRRLGVAPSDLDDLTQEVFVTAFQRIATYDAGRPLRPWLFGIAFRIASARRERAFVHKEVGGDAMPEAPDEAPSPHRAMENAQTLARVLKALETLRMERKAVFILHDIEGQSVPEVAAALSIPLNTAYTRLRAARADFTDAFRKTSEDTR